MLDVCACVIVEEEKERKARGNLCAEVRGIMVWRNRVGHETRVLVLYVQGWACARQCCMTLALTMTDRGLYTETEDRCLSLSLL
jgi:hypothetical protein